MHFRGRPFLYLYDSYQVPRDEWRALLSANGASTIRGTKYDCTMIALLVEVWFSSSNTFCSCRRILLLHPLTQHHLLKDEAQGRDC